MYGFVYITLGVALAFLPQYLQWKIISLGLPWIGKLIGLLVILFGWIYFRFAIMPQPSDCIQPLSCEWAGILLLFITYYSIADMILAVIGGNLIHYYFRKRVWAANDIILQTGKNVYITILVVSILLAGYFISLSSIPDMLSVWFKQ